MNILLSKLFAGTFNDDNIGHEVINLYRQDNEQDLYHYLYIAPYGSVGSNNNKQYGYLDDASYKTVKYIIFLLKTEINYVFKIVAVAKDVETFNNEREINQKEEEIEFNHKKLKNLQFGIMSEDEIEEYFSDHYVSKITYKVKRSNYFDLRTKNIYIYTYNNKNAKNTFIKNQESFRNIYPNQLLHKLEFLPTWHNYKFMNDDDGFETWFNNNIGNYLVAENRYDLLPVTDRNSNGRIIYHVDNIINFMDKGNDENIITNMLRKILLWSDDLYEQFVSFLKTKAGMSFEIGRKYKPIKQQSSLTESENIILKYINARSDDQKIKYKNELIDKFDMTEVNINSFNKENKPRKGYIDLYLEGDNFRFVLENKVKSGLNDVYIDDENNQLSQLDKYKKYLDSLNNTKGIKNNKIFIIAPDYHYVFNTGSINCCIIKYSELYDFFVDKEHNNIKEEYYNLFINAIAKHARTLDDVIKDRFVKITNEM